MKKETNTYLSQLQFDKKLLTSFKAKYLTNIRLVLLLVILIIVSGVFSYINLPRRLDPEIKIPIVAITTVLPGAGPEDVESLVTIPLEDSLNGIKGITNTTSNSNESVSTLVVEFSSGIDPEKAKTDVQNAIDTLTTLPEDASDPRVQTFDFEDRPVWTFALTTNSEYSDLQVISDILEKKLKNISTIDRVVTTGRDQKEIHITVTPSNLSLYGISPFTLSSAIPARINSYPSGFVDSKNLSFPIGIDAQIKSLEDIRNTIIFANGYTLRIGDIATISESVKPNQSSAFYADRKTAPTKVISFSVYKTSSTTIDRAVEDAKKSVDETLNKYPGTFRIYSVQDASKSIADEFGNLLNNFRDTLILVFITFFIFLGIRQAFIASITIPLTFFVTFTVMGALGISLNFLSLFSLLLSLGLLVDDTIVIVTGISSYYRSGKFTPVEVGLLVWRDFIVPIWSTTITTVWAFIPLLLSTGIIGEFIKTIPIVVATTLYSSTAIAVLITLPLMMIILKLHLPKRVVILILGVVFVGLNALLYSFIAGNALSPLIITIFGLFLFLTFTRRKELHITLSSMFPYYIKTITFLHKNNYIFQGIISLEKISFRYKRVMKRILISQGNRRKTIFTVIIFSVFSFMLVPLGFVVNEFFPKTDAELLYVTVELPNGTNLKKSQQEAYSLINTIKNTEGVLYVTSETGKGLSSSGENLTGDNYVLLSLVLPKVEDQEISSISIAKKLRSEMTLYKGGKVSVIEISGGPPAGSDIQIELSGDDLTVLDQYAERIISFLQKEKGIINLDKSIKEGTSKLTFIPDSQKMANYGVSIDTLGYWLRLFHSGIKIDSMKIGGDSKDIILRMSDDNQNPSSLGSLLIPSNQGYIPITALGSIELRPNPNTITRKDGKRTLVVSASLTPGNSVTTENKRLEEFATNMPFQEGYGWKTGGVNEENQKSVNSIFVAMILAAILIFATMVVQFTSYRKAILVMLVIPLAISGVFILFSLSGTPLSFPALIGILSLFGIVVNNAMMLVDKINLNRKVGMEVIEAISDASASRLEPIFLGSLTTIMGLIPITISDPLWRGLGGAIIAGLSVSGIIMLFFIPVMYYWWFRGEKVIKKLA